MRQLLDYAAEQSFGLPAFNVNNMEQVHAIMQAADAVDAPVIMQGSAGARSYAGEAFLRHLISAAIEQYPHIRITSYNVCYTKLLRIPVLGFVMRRIKSALSSQ